MILLIICPHFTPDVAPTGEVMTAIVESLAARGHRLHVVTSLPWYRLHDVEPGWRGRPWRTETTPWGRITRLHPFPTDKTNIVARALGFAGFTGAATVAALCSRIRPDAVMVMSPPLPLGVSGWLAAAVRGVPFVFNIQDVFPDVAVELGVITNPTVIAVSEDLRGNLAAKLAGHGPGRVRVIPNFVDTERIRPGDRMTPYRERYGLGDRLVVMYAGNVGMSQSLELVLDAARRNLARRDLVFVINGGGSAQKQLMDAGADLANLRFVEMQPRERLTEVLASADIHVIPLRSGLARASVPSKLYSILAAGRPVVASVDAGTEVATTIAAACAGIAVGPDDPEAFSEALGQLIDDPQRRRAMGDSGRRFVQDWVSPAAVAEAYERLFGEVCERRRASHRRRGGS